MIGLEISIRIGTEKRKEFLESFQVLSRTFNNRIQRLELVLRKRKHAELLSLDGTLGLGRRSRGIHEQRPVPYADGPCEYTRDTQGSQDSRVSFGTGLERVREQPFDG